MPKSSFRERLEQAGLELIWRQWTEAGVSGWSAGSTFAIDPEALILLTAFLGDADPRLRDEALDWCITYGRFISAARLRNMLKTQSESVRGAFAPFAATVNAHTSFRWPGATRPWQYMATKKSRIVDFTRPTLISLRLRALFGVSARPEIVTAMLTGWRKEWTAADLTEDVHYTKRNVAEALDALRMSGLLEASRVRNQRVYTIKDEPGFHAFFGPVAAQFVKWPELIRVFVDLHYLAGVLLKMDDRVKTVEIANFLEAHRSDLRRTGIAQPTIDRADVAATLERWATETFSAIASGSPPAAASLLSDAR